MDNHFLLVFFLVSCIEALEPLKCITCHLRLATDRCRRGFGVCVAQKSETCMILKVYKDDYLQLSYMVCQKFCRDLTFNFDNRTYVHKCCNHNFFCRTNDAFLVFLAVYLFLTVLGVVVTSAFYLAKQS